MSRNVVTDAAEADKPNRNPCLVPVTVEKGMRCATANQVLMGIDANARIAECVPLYRDGEFKWVTPGSEKISWDLPLNSMLKLFFSKPKQGDPKLTGKFTVPASEFEDVLTLSGPLTPRAQALADINAVLGPDGSTLKMLATEDVWHGMTSPANRHAMIKKLSTKRTKAGDIKDPDEIPEKEAQRLQKLQEELRDAMEPSVKTSFVYKAPIKFHYNKKSGDLESVQFEFTVPLFAALSNGATRTDEQTASMLEGMHPDSSLAEWISENPHMWWKPGIDDKVTTVYSDNVRWSDILKLGNQWDMLDVIGTIRIVPFRCSMSKEYGKFVGIHILDELKIYSVVRSGKRKATTFNDEQAALYDELLNDAKRQRVDDSE